MNTARKTFFGLLPALVVAFVACSGDEYTQDGTFACPDQELFIANVSPLIERRCGTLDCHGTSFRPMRVYGRLGLRHPVETNVSGGAPTTQAELLANYSAICTLDPEPMAEAVKDRGSSAEKLLLVNKARGLEAHKGGIVVAENDPADRCILGWIKRLPPEQLKADCDAALAQLEPK